MFQNSPKKIAKTEEKNIIETKIIQKYSSPLDKNQYFNANNNPYEKLNIHKSSKNLNEYIDPDQKIKRSKGNIAFRNIIKSNSNGNNAELSKNDKLELPMIRVSSPTKQSPALYKSLSRPLMKLSANNVLSNNKEEHIKQKRRLFSPISNDSEKNNSRLRKESFDYLNSFTSVTGTNLNIINSERNQSTDQNSEKKLIFPKSKNLKINCNRKIFKSTNEMVKVNKDNKDSKDSIEDHKKLNSCFNLPICSLNNKNSNTARNNCVPNYFDSRSSNNYNLSNSNSKVSICLPHQLKHKMQISGISYKGKDTENKKKFNQDSYIILEKIFELSNYSIFGVMDGHGDNGHLVSQYIKQRIEEYFKDYKNYLITEENVKKVENPNELISEFKIIKLLKSNNFYVIRNFFDLITKELNEGPIDVTYSGSTAVIIFKVGMFTITANIGDSRAILITENMYTKLKMSSNNNPKKLLNNLNSQNGQNSQNNSNQMPLMSSNSRRSSSNSLCSNIHSHQQSLFVEQLSDDHKPTDKKESERILRQGGEIHKYGETEEEENDEYNPLRVWAKGKTYPGIAVTRSIGDSVAEKIGVIHNPEIKIKLLNETGKCIVACSDGVWDFLSNGQVMKIVMECYNNGMKAEDACEKVALTAREEWENNIDGEVDDITAVVCFLEK